MPPIFVSEVHWIKAAVVRGLDLRDEKPDDKTSSSGVGGVCGLQWLGS